MSKNLALAIAGIVFSLVAIVHLLRYFYDVSITVSNYVVPQWVSIVGFCIAFILALVMFIARKN